MAMHRLCPGEGVGQTLLWFQLHLETVLVLLDFWGR